MRDVFFLLFHLLTTAAKLIRPGGARSIIAENLLLKQQLIIHNRSRQLYSPRGGRARYNWSLFHMLYFASSAVAMFEKGVQGYIAILGSVLVCALFYAGFIIGKLQKE
jgi:hypothetical protein